MADTLQLQFFKSSDAPVVDPRPTSTAPWTQFGSVTLYRGDNIDVLRAMPDNSVDALVSDPPYGIGFMGKEWDTFTPGRRRPDAESRESQRARTVAQSGAFAESD